MAEKTHIVKQEESVAEKSTQIRAGEPIALKDPHYWLDTNSNTLYLHIGGTKYVIANGQKSIDLASGVVIDAKAGSTFHRVLDNNLSFTVNNLNEEGKIVRLVLNNTTGSNYTASFTGITIANAPDMVANVKGGRIAIFEFMYLNGAVYCLQPVRTESVFA